MSLVLPGPIVNHYRLSRKKHIYLSDHRYCVKLAENMDEIDAALRLRFEVFNIELNEGLESSFHTLRDEDEFDTQCHHLLVIEKKTNEVIGTYRLQTNEMARSGIGFYSAGEFEINRLGWLRLMQSVELGRACISQAHRNGRVLFLLWKGIGQYMQVYRKRYLFGCCSLSSQNPLEGTVLMNQLVKQGLVRSNPLIPAKRSYTCFLHGCETTPLMVTVPPLMEMYFRYGAKVCSYPAIDRAFKTIDFLVLLDMNDMSDETRRLFL